MSKDLNTVIAVDSQDREALNISTPANYVYKLPTTLRNADSIELMSFQMVRTDTNINDGNCTLLVSFGGTQYTCNITQGEITTGSALATALQTALIANVDASFLVTYSATANNLTITNPAAFSIYMASSSTARVLGLAGNGVRNAGTVTATLISSLYTVTGTRYIDLAGDPYVMMYVNDYQRLIGQHFSLQTATFMIPLEKKAWLDRFVMCSDEKEKKSIYYLTNNQRRIDQLTIKFLRPDGSYYNFHGVDHQMIFRVTKPDTKDYVS